MANGPNKRKSGSSMSKEHGSVIYHPPRKSLRLRDYDYGSSGAYFVTLCTRRRQPFFVIPALRQILEAQWEALPYHFLGITPDTFMVMPDHLHAILWIDANVRRSPNLSEAIGGYKSIVSVAWQRYLEREGLEDTRLLWQRSFNDHIIRNEQDLQVKRKYILDNPIKAELKRERSEK
jgi:REP element-mobilizing transposase RayT